MTGGATPPPRCSGRRGTGLRDGAIVLAHDWIGPGARRTDVRETIAYTRLVADHALKAGLELEPVE